MDVRWFTVALVALLALARVHAGEAQTRPTTKPAANVTERAASVMQRMAAGYAALKSLELSGQATMVVEEPGGRREHQADFTGVYVAPNRFKHQMKDQPTLGSDGRHVYAHSERRGAYVQAEASTDKLVFNQLPREVAALLPMQNISLALAVSKDPAAELKEMASAIDLGEPMDLEGSRHQQVVVTMPGGATMRLLLDPRTHLVRRMVMDLAPMLRQQGRQDIKSAVFTVDYTAIKPGAAVDAQALAWSPPEGARELAVVMAGGQEEHGHDHAEATALVGRPAPDFELSDLAGQTVKLSEAKGSVVILDFWASWCGPCVAALPRLARIQEDYAAKGLKVYAINLRETKQEAAEFVAANKLSLRVLLDGQGAVAERYGVEAIPQTVVIGRDGTVRKVIVGFEAGGEDDLRKLIDAQLGAAGR